MYIYVAHVRVYVHVYMYMYMFIFCTTMSKYTCTHIRTCSVYNCTCTVIFEGPTDITETILISSQPWCLELLSVQQSFSVSSIRCWAYLWEWFDTAGLKSAFLWPWTAESVSTYWSIWSYHSRIKCFGETVHKYVNTSVYLSCTCTCMCMLIIHFVLNCQYCNSYTTCTVYTYM